MEFVQFCCLALQPDFTHWNLLTFEVLHSNPISFIGFFSLLAKFQRKDRAGRGAWGGQARAGPCGAGQGGAGQAEGRGQGKAGKGRARQDRAGQGRAGQRGTKPVLTNPFLSAVACSIRLGQGMDLLTVWFDD